MTFDDHSALHDQPAAEQGYSAKRGVNIKALVVELLEAHGNDVEAAAQEGARRTRQNIALFTALFEDRIYSAWHRLCADAMRNERGRMRRELRAQGKEPAGDPRQATSAARAQDAARSILAWSLLANGKRLGDATHEDLDDAIHHRRAQIQTMDEEARFLEAVREQLPEGATVGEAMTADQVMALYNAARSAA